MKLHIIFLLLAAITAAGSGIFYLYWNQLEKRSQDMIYVSGQAQHIRWQYTLYHFLQDNVITGRYIRKVQKRFEQLEPGEPEKVEKDTMETLLKGGLLSLLVALVSVQIEVSFYMLAITVLTLAFVQSMVLETSVKEKERKLRLQMKEAIGTIEYNYYQSRSVDIALYDSMLDFPYPVRAHMKKVYHVITSENQEEEIENYNYTAPNRFFKEFLSLCINIMRYDDCSVEGIPLFVRGLYSLSQDIDIEQRKQERLDHAFLGLSLVSALPVYFMPWISNWFMGNVPQLSRYYNGNYALVSTVLIFLVTIFAYANIGYLREMEYHRKEKHVILEGIAAVPWISGVASKIISQNAGKKLRIDRQLRRLGESLTVEQFYIKRFIYFFITLLGSIVLIFCLHRNTCVQQLGNVDFLDEAIMTIAEDDEIVEIKKNILFLTDKYKKIELTTQELLSEPVIQNIAEGLQGLVIEEILERVEKYQKEYFKWYELLLSLCMAVAASFLPVLWIWRSGQLIRMEMENEVIQFQSIISVMKYMERVSTKEILEQLEQFAVIFKKSITDCLNTFSQGENEALEELKEKEENADFRRVVDGLIMADRSSIKKAFCELEEERKLFQEKRKQDNAIYIDRKSAEAFFMAFIPTVFVIGLYILIPFTLDVLVQFNATLTNFKTM